jgi:peptide-methionine (S)-S-oxide reductase
LSSICFRAVRIEFDPGVVTYDELVGTLVSAFVSLLYSELWPEFFYRTHDPTTVNRQGGDVGTQYRSSIFTSSPEQEEIAKRVTQEVQEKHFTPKGKTIVTDILGAGPWWDAEEYHQLYLFKVLFS